VVRSCRNVSKLLAIVVRSMTLEEEDEEPTPLTVMMRSYTNRLTPPDEAMPR
jgi:hypothetical protein